MLAFLKPRWVLLIILLLFVIFKIPHLAYPYYWDESWPYATGVADMYKNGVSLIPGAIDRNVSRGHPMFFHVMAALWGKLFGLSHVSMHSFALCISLLFMVVIYESALRLFNMRVAILSLLVVCTQVIFLVQSSYLLLEILVAFLAFASTYSYVRGRYLQTCIYLSMLFYTKESGLIMGFVLGMDALINLRLFTKATWKEHAARLLAIGVPCVLMGVFFLLQKHINGWYVLPLYTESMEHSWDKFWYMLGHCPLTSVFMSDYRQWYYFVAAALVVFVAISKRKFGLLAILIPMPLIYLMGSDYYARSFAGSITFFTCFLLAIALALYVIAKLFPNAVQRRFIYLLGTFTICFAIFSSTNYFTYRYMLASIVPALYLLGIFTEKMTALTKPWLYYVALAGMMGISIYAYTHDEGNGDTDVTCYANMEIQQDVINYLAQRNAYNASISADAYMDRQHLTDPTTGYLENKRVFTNVKYEIDGGTQYIVVDNIENGAIQPIIAKLPDFHLVHRMQKGEKWLEIYERR